VLCPGPDIEGHHRKLAPRTDAPGLGQRLTRDVETGELPAQSRLAEFLQTDAAGYSTEGERLDRNGTHLRFGEVSPRQAWHAARFAAAEPALRLWATSTSTSPNWAGANSAGISCSTRPISRRAICSPLSTHFRGGMTNSRCGAWQRGQTGYPIVDPGMRELWRTGVMHNRVRMVAASFLVKHLLIDWREGEKWFWDTLVDADPAATRQLAMGRRFGCRCGTPFSCLQPDPAGREVRSRWRLCQPLGARTGALAGQRDPPAMERDAARARRRRRRRRVRPDVSPPYH
jgi:deoxyribodipyrimidine photolyase